MTPFFKRKRDRGEVPEVPTSPETSVTLDNDPGTEAQGDVVTSSSPAPEADEDPRPEGPSAHEMVDRAFYKWRRQLAEESGADVKPLSSLDPSVVDLSSQHPTGGAQLASGMPTLLSSLIREEGALQVARGRLASLQHQLSLLNETYGYAPVSLAIGEISWRSQTQSTPISEPTDSDDPDSELAGADVEGTSSGDAARSAAPSPEDSSPVSPEPAASTSPVSAPAEPASSIDDDSDGLELDFEGFGEEENESEVPEWAKDPAEEAEPPAQTESPAQPEAAAENEMVEPAETSTQAESPAQAESPSQSEARVVEAAEPEERTEAALYREVRLTAHGDADAYITLTAKCKVNPALEKELIAAGANPDDLKEIHKLVADPAEEEAGLTELRDLCRRYLDDYGYEPKVLLGNFTHPGAVLLADLEAMHPYIESSGVMAALAGDKQTRGLSSAPLPPPELSDRSPEAERGAGDRDVEELAAIEAVASGRSVVINTPPGSEKVGTLAGIVADAAASGRSVLYIPGGATAGRALIDELENLDLGDIALDFSDVESVAMRLRTGMRLRHKDAPSVQISANRSQLVSVRKELTSYFDALHSVDEEWGESVYSLLERLAELTATEDGPTSRIRVQDDALKTLHESREEVIDQFTELARLGTFSPHGAASAWTGSRINTVDEATKALERATRLSQESLPVVIAQAQRGAGEASITRAASLDEWVEQIKMLSGIADTLDVFLPQVYERSAEQMVIATGSNEWREQHGHSMKRSERRHLTRQARDLVRPGATATDLHAELVKVQDLRDVWRRYSSEGGWPTLPDGMNQIKIIASEVYNEVEALEAVLAPGTDLSGMPFEDLLVYLRQLASGQDAMATLPRRNALIDDLQDAALGDIYDELANRHVAADKVRGEIELIYTNSVFERLVVRSPLLSGMGPGELTRLTEEFRYLDKEHTATLAGPVHRAVVRLMRETISKRREETVALDEHLARYDSGGLRDAITSYTRIVQVARPVWVMPSMMAAEFIPAMPWVDLVIMDEMDAAKLHSSISMLMRGRQIVVMGDMRRATADSAIKALADVLPVCPLPTIRAKYDELATQTLREQGYGDLLQMVPALPRTDRARLVTVNGRGVPSPATGTVEGTQAEVDAVVDMVVEHTLTQPEKSLAVVCVSEHHAARVREAMRQTIAKSTVLGSLTERDTHEPFVILDITKCSGLRRDSVILSVGYGKTVHGRVLHSFGSLATPRGVAGLVDAVEAARGELTIISALGPGEIGVENITAPGPRLLGKLIDRAGGAVVQLDPTESGAPVAPLLAELSARLERAGWQTAAHFGYEDGVRIPLVAGHSRFRGTWRVAILIDDDEYVAEQSLRRRDRYWVERLTSRGWSVFRTFSTSLFVDPKGQAQAVIDILEKTKRSELGAAVLPVEPAPSLTNDSWSVSTPAPLPAPAPQPAEVRAKPRGTRPQLTPGLPLAAYSDDQLDDIVTWISSDGVPRTEDELVAAIREELDIHRRGSQTDAVLRNVVSRSRAGQDDELGAGEGPATLGDITAVRPDDEA
ncbi:MAG: hypothetical protein ACTHYS_03750 [Ancrocorticia populi]|uniref:hypothetical protein n=1 Tax=Ancrocorticia populi TaxID=2175228 RepID=UPI003F9003D4